MTFEWKNKVAIPVVLLLGVFIGGVTVLQSKGLLAGLISEGKKVFFPIASEPDADPDSDGLKNWEEKIYKTDPRNPDTDGDGYLDGEEATSGYDPTISAPNDALAGTDPTAARPLPKNLTTHLAQILTQKISAGEFDPASFTGIDLNDPTLPYNEEVMGEALAQIALRAKAYFTLPELKDSDIKISQGSTTAEEAAHYITAMSAALAPTDAFIALNKSEVDVIQEAVEKKDVRNVEVLLASLQNNIASARSIVVPEGFADTHKKHIAILMLDEKILEAVRNFRDDPVTAAAGVEVYPQLIEMLQALTEELNAKIESYQT